MAVTPQKRDNVVRFLRVVEIVQEINGLISPAMQVETFALLAKWRDMGRPDHLIGDSLDLGAEALGPIRHELMTMADRGVDLCDEIVPLLEVRL